MYAMNVYVQMLRQVDRVDQIRLGQIRLDQTRLDLDQVRLGYVRLDSIIQIRLDQIRLGLRLRFGFDSIRFDSIDRQIDRQIREMD